MITKLKLYTESHKYIPEYILVIQTHFIGSDQIIDLYDFTDAEYDRYKADKMNYREEKEIMQMAIDEIGLVWDIEDDELVITTNSIGEEERVQLVNPYDEEDEEEEFHAFDYRDEYSDDDLEDMAIVNMGIEWEIIPNKKHPDYKKKQKSKKFNI
jgi:hypothetical protein